MPSTRGSRLNKKETIIAAATYFFSSKGFKDSSIADISKASGVATATIFYHFKTKEDLFVAVLAAVKEGIVEEFEAYSRQRDFANGLEMAEGAILFYYFLADRKKDWFLLLHRNYPFKMVEENAVCRGHLEDVYNCFLDIFERAILRGQEDGSIKKVAARKTALILFSMIDGIVRLNSLDLYDSGTLCRDSIEACRRMLQSGKR
jgi:AcrR family transcriptional regulator